MKVEIEVTLVQISADFFEYSNVSRIGGRNIGTGLGTEKASNIEEAKRKIAAMFGVPLTDDPWVPTELGWRFVWSFTVKP